MFRVNFYWLCLILAALSFSAPVRAFDSPLPSPLATPALTPQLATETSPPQPPAAAPSLPAPGNNGPPARALELWAGVAVFLVLGLGVVILLFR
jgi:hypothetical protein